MTTLSGMDDAGVAPMLPQAGVVGYQGRHGR
ncbi:hypothetical protein BOFL111202_00720 [Bordetella flabilis]